MTANLAESARLCCAAFLLFAQVSVCADQVLIVNPATSPDVISLNQSRLIFSMQLDQWPDGAAVEVFVLPDDDPTHRAFSKNILRLYPRQLRRVWDRQLYSGTGRAPQVVADEDEMRRLVAETPGAIGYLSRDNIDESVQALSFP